MENRVKLLLGLIIAILVATTCVYNIVNKPKEIAKVENVNIQYISNGQSTQTKWKLYRITTKNRRNNSSINNSSNSTFKFRNYTNI